MKKLFIIITTGLFSLTALAQPTPTTFLDVQITGSKETVAQQLMDAGFTEFTKLDMYEGEFMGEQVTVRMSWWKPAKQVSSLFISGTQKYESAEAIRKFHNIISEFEKDPNTLPIQPIEEFQPEQHCHTSICLITGRLRRNFIRTGIRIRL